MTSNRPALSSKLTASEFLRHYWLKSELVGFCRSVGLSSAGGKIEITQRIEVFLASGERMAPPSRATVGQSAKMTDYFTLSTVIVPGFRCSQGLRAFFEREIGHSFHFNGVMREFITNRIGCTLGEAIQAYLESKASPLKTEIAPQFEYNRHIREYFELHPGASRKEAIAAWKKKREDRSRK
jgi:hypothetical protein